MITLQEINSLTSETILSEEVICEVLEESDEVFKARLLLTLIDKAKDLGVKGKFEALISAYKKEKSKFEKLTAAKPMNRIENDGMTHFDGDYAQLYTGGWIADESGIRIVTSRFEEIVACSHPILPVRALINAETKYHKIILAFKTRNKWEEVLVDKEIISTNNKITSLAKHGIRVTSENARALVRFLADIESMNDSVIPVQLSTAKLGWLNGGFIPYDDRVVFDNSEALSGAFESIRQSGSYVKWIELMKNIRKINRIEPKIYLAGAFASPLLHKFNALPFIINTYGKTGKGKTVALMVASSVWADPTEGKYWVKAKANEVALEARLDFLNHLPLAIDDFSEIQKKMKDDFSGYVYSICSGGGKERSNVNIGLQRQRHWKNIILTNSERSLINDTMQGGAINRIIEFESEVGNIFGDISESQEVINTVKEHYGHAGKEFIEIISEMDLNKLKDIQKGFQDLLYQKAKDMGIEKEDKQILPMSIIMTADKIATDHIFEDGIYLDIDTCFHLLKSKEEVSEEERAYDFIMSDVSIHHNNFVPDMLGNYKGDVWGCLEDGYVVIHGNIFKGMCERGNFSSKSFLSWADCNELLKYGIEKKVKKFKGEAKRCIYLKLDSSSEDDLEADTEFTEISDQQELPFV